LTWFFSTTSESNLRFISSANQGQVFFAEAISLLLSRIGGHLYRIQYRNFIAIFPILAGADGAGI